MASSGCEKRWRWGSNLESHGFIFVAVSCLNVCFCDLDCGTYAFKMSHDMRYQHLLIAQDPPGHCYHCDEEDVLFQMPQCQCQVGAPGPVFRPITVCPVSEHLGPGTHQMPGAGTRGALTLPWHYPAQLQQFYLTILRHFITRSKVHNDMIHQNRIK